MTVAVLLLIATLLPLLSFVILAFVGKRMDNPLAGIVGTFFISASFVASLAAMIVWLSLDVAEGRAFGFGGQPILKVYDWLPGGLQIGIYVDSLTVVMFSMITLVAALVHVFSLGYMAEDRRFPRFYTYLGLFSFSMLALVLSGTLLQLFIFWELVGLCSYLLIGFWYEKKTASNAAIKAFVTNRIGDIGFIIGLGLLFAYLGNATYPGIWSAPGQITTPMLTLIGIVLFCGAIGKSAQFPLHVWLPDAMEGPTPVSALIHAATMVAAGVYLVGRIFPILTPDAKLFIAIIGCVTMTMAALIATAQTDIKRVLAYSTVSQLGLMILAMGIGSWVGGLFHLITHAFFKALLFLGAGNVIHAAHHEQELTEFGGLWRKIPYTAITFGVAVLAIAGVGITVGDTMIGFAGYYSKDLILHHAGSYAWLATRTGGHPAYWLFFILPTLVAYLTAFYMTRCWMLTFAGKPRNQRLYEHARETPVMYIPLAVLAVLSVIGGTALGARPMIESAAKETNNYFDPHLRPPTPPVAASPTAPVPPPAHFAGYSTAWQNAGAYAQVGDTPSIGVDAYRFGEHSLRFVSSAFVFGIGIGVLIYSKGLAIPTALLRFPPLRWLRIWLYRAMYFDELYAGIVVAFTMALATVISIIDRYLIDAIVNLTARIVRSGSVLAGLSDRFVFERAVSATTEMVQEIGVAVRAPQTGRIRTYVTALMVALALCLAGAIIVVLSTT